MTIFDGCKNSVSPTFGYTLSTSVVKDSIQYTFAIPKYIFGIHDTLTANLTAFNQRSVPETLYTGASIFSWFLQTQSGRKIMYGPKASPLNLYPVVIGSHKIIILHFISEKIADTSGQPVTAGIYSLHANTIYSLFVLEVSLQ
jgi:hypothetical protein